MVTTHETSTKFSDKILLRRILFKCGIFSSIYYVAINILMPTQFVGYSTISQTVSELSAIDAPTRPLWVLLATAYVLLFGAFGLGVWQSAKRNRALRIVGGLIMVYCVINIYWPPMHLRGNEMSLTDTLHIVWAMIAVVFMMVMMGFGAVAFGRQFRLYTIISMVLHIVFGILTALDAPKLAANLPTPLIGVWERINIGIFMLWVIVLAAILLKRESSNA